MTPVAQRRRLGDHRARVEARINRLHARPPRPRPTQHRKGAHRARPQRQRPQPPIWRSRSIAGSAVDLFNYTWTLIEKADRTPAEIDEMIHAAHASRYHWSKAGTTVNLGRGEWQVARVYAVLGRGGARPVARRRDASHMSRRRRRRAMPTTGTAAALRGPGPGRRRSRASRRGRRVARSGPCRPRRHQEPRRSRGHRGRPRSITI